MGLTINKIKTFIYYTIYKRKLKLPKEWYEKGDELDKFQHILEAINYVRIAELPPVFFEFGCHSGRTFSAAILASQFFRTEMDLYAFDSFQGLPETKKEEDGFFESGSFFTAADEFKKIIKSKTGISMPDDHIIKGFYENTLNDSLSRFLPKKVGFVHIDVDLYSSTVTVLEFLKNHLADGTIILFDDWYCFPPGKNMGEKRALKEFCVKYSNIKFTEWKNYSTFGKSFFVEITG